MHFENYQASSGSVVPTTEPSTTGNPTTVTYEVTLTNPGDYYEFTIDAVNGGSLDAMIESISSKLNDVEIDNSHPLPPYLSYSATYSDGVAIANKQELLHNTREKLKLRVAYRDDIATTDLPSTVQDLSFSFTITYIQADNTAIPVPHQYNVYRWATTEWVRNQSISSFTVGTDYVLEESQVTNMDSRASNYYLKYLISSKAVAESYLAFVVTNAMAQANPGMTAGTYYLRGGINESSLAEKPIYEANKAVLLSAFGSSYCATSFTYFNCIVDELFVQIGTSGTTYAEDDDGNCSVDSGEPSYCAN